MKISVVITEGYKQVMLSPETDHERNSLKLIAPDDVLKGVSRWGTYDDKPRYAGEQSAMCQGGYVRRFATEDSLMFVIEDKEKSAAPQH